MDRLIYICAAIILAFGCYFFWNKSDELQQTVIKTNQKIVELEEKSKIKISQTSLTDVTKFTFLEINSEFQYLYEKTKGSWFKKDKIGVLYGWDYTFSFGFDLTDKPDWNWCPFEVENEPGVIRLNAPQIVQTNANQASPNPIRVFNDAYWNDFQIEIASEVQKYADDKMSEVASVYLTNPTTVSSIKNALAAHLQRVMNSAYADSNPISEVIIEFTDECATTD